MKIILRWGQGRGQRPFGTFSKIHLFWYHRLSLKLMGSICPVCCSLLKGSIQVFLGVSSVIASLCTEHYVPGPVPRPVSSWKGESRRSIWCWNILSTKYVWSGVKWNTFRRAFSQRCNQASQGKSAKRPACCCCPPSLDWSGESYFRPPEIIN